MPVASDSPRSTPFAAVVLAGGAGRRMGGADKAGLPLGGRTLLQRTLAAARRATEVVVVGDPHPDTGSGVRFVREQPAYAGPAAAALTGLAALHTAPERVVVLAVDMPLVTSRTVRRLLAVPDDADGVVLVDARGRQQPAFSVRAARLRDVAPAAADWPGLSLRRLLAPLDLRPLAAAGAEARDVDTWAGLEGLARHLATVESEPVNLHDWVDELCDVLEVDTEVDEALVLDVARVAAHGVTKTAAPVTTYLLGLAAGMRGADPEQVERLAARATSLAEGWDRPAGSADPVDVDTDIPDDSAIDHSRDSLDD